MKVTCKQLTSESFDLKEVTTVFSNSFDYSFGGYGLELGKEYTVMGILMYRDTNCLYYLIDVNGNPNWFPYLLFNISNNYLSCEWFIKVNGRTKDNHIHTIWGFYELCYNDSFYDQLLDREEEAMQIYFRRKGEIEREIM